MKDAVVPHNVGGEPSGCNTAPDSTGADAESTRFLIGCLLRILPVPAAF
jgi:hypothetical protein